MNKPFTNGRAIIWLLLLQEFNITILDQRGKQNIIVYFLSRIQNDNNVKCVEDKFPNEYIFVVSIKLPWFTHIPNYLVIGKLPSYLFPREKRRIIQTSIHYSWINQELCKKGPYLII